MTSALPVSSAARAAAPGGPADADDPAPAGRLPRNAFLGTDGRLRRCRWPAPQDPSESSPVCRTCGRGLLLVASAQAYTGAYWRHRARTRRASGSVR